MRVYGAFALVLIAVAAAIGPLPARADETVSIGGSRAVLLKPAAPRASVILMPGGDGQIAAGSGGAIGRLNPGDPTAIVCAAGGPDARETRESSPWPRSSP